MAALCTTVPLIADLGGRRVAGHVSLHRQGRLERRSVAARVAFQGESACGAYSTDIEPTPANLRTLYKRIRVPKAKQEYVFWFEGDFGLVQLNDGRGRDRRIWFSPVDYVVGEARQKYEGPTDDLAGQSK